MGSRSRRPRRRPRPSGHNTVDGEARRSAALRRPDLAKVNPRCASRCLAALLRSARLCRPRRPPPREVRSSIRSDRHGARSHRHRAARLRPHRRRRRPPPRPDRAELRRNGMSRLSTLLQSVPGPLRLAAAVERRRRRHRPARVHSRAGRARTCSFVSTAWTCATSRTATSTGTGCCPRTSERVEVVQGAGAWLYGDGTRGGIVNIVRPGSRAARGRVAACGTECGARGQLRPVDRQPRPGGGARR